MFVAFLLLSSVYYTPQRIAATVTTVRYVPCVNHSIPFRIYLCLQDHHHICPPTADHAWFLSAVVF